MALRKYASFSTPERILHLHGCFFMCVCVYFVYVCGGRLFMYLFVLVWRQLILSFWFVLFWLLWSCGSLSDPTMDRSSNALKRNINPSLSVHHLSGLPLTNPFHLVSSKALFWLSTEVESRKQARTLAPISLARLDVHVTKYHIRVALSVNLPDK